MYQEGFRPSRALSHYNSINPMPRRQGPAYLLNLGYNDGPYPNRDLMRSNGTSVHLLAGKSVFPRHITTTNQIELMSSSAIQVDSLDYQINETELQRSLVISEGRVSITKQILQLQSKIYALGESVYENQRKNRGFKDQLAALQSTASHALQEVAAFVTARIKFVQAALKQQDSICKSSVLLSERQLNKMTRQTSEILRQILQCKKSLKLLDHRIGLKDHIQSANLDLILD